MKRTRETFGQIIAKTSCAAALTLGTLCLPTLTHAETSVATVPQGYVTLTVAPGTGDAYRQTVLSMPLLDTATISGQVTGIITSVTANAITNQNAGWTANQLSAADTPYVIRITSGSAQGRTFLLSTSTANTAIGVTLDATETTDLTTLGITVGTDTYELIPCDTIAGIFGVPAIQGILGKSSPEQADQIIVRIGTSWRKFYYNTTTNDWRMVGADSPANNIPILPQSAVIYCRWPNSALPITVTGRIPNIKRTISVASSGTSLISTGWPTSLTLDTSGINQMSGWVSNADPNVADFVQLTVGTAWRKYYHDGNIWRMVGSDQPSGTASIPIGGGAMIIKKGSATGKVTLTQELPYSL